MSKVSEVVICAAKYLGLTELVAAINAGGTLSGERLTERNDLLRCVNIAAADIALSATAPVNSKICRAVSGSIFYSAIDDKLLEIETVKTTAGKTAEYTVYSDRILIKDGTYYVYYTYVPAKMQPDDDLPFSAAINERALVYGACAEYCVATGVNGEAVKWQSLFEREIAKIKNKKARLPGIMPARKWF